ncbi:MAG: hypothetical protein HYR63_07975 [Proteobacteria bacterium]|nr:hypothetical protein [Pseudomonadota bacterium]MBI3499798.1 hypothetical protein [Pseudomonadota bacterium]
MISKPWRQCGPAFHRAACIGLALLGALGPGGPARASFHTFQIVELFSNADGTVQFVKLREAFGYSGQNFLSGISLTSTSAAGRKVLTFPSNLPSFATAGKSVLIATQAFANLGLVVPDYVFPAGFLSTAGGTLDYGSVDVVTYSALPIDGCQSVGRTGVKSAATPASFSGGASTLSCQRPQSGWWWNPAEAGRGFSLEVNAQGRIFFSSYLYADDASSLWLTASGALATAAAYQGTLDQYGNGQTLAGLYQPATRTGSPGALTVSFATPTTGALTWPGGSMAIQRFDIVAGGAAAGPAAGMPETGWWWNASEGGRGFFFEVQGTTMFLSGFMYDAVGRPVWYTSLGAMTGTTVYQGRLLQYAGGQTLTGAYRPPSTSSDAGAVSVQFSTTTTASLTLPNGTRIQLTRFTF